MHGECLSSQRLEKSLLSNNEYHYTRVNGFSSISLGMYLDSAVFRHYCSSRIISVNDIRKFLPIGREINFKPVKKLSCRK